MALTDRDSDDEGDLVGEEDFHPGEGAETPELDDRVKAAFLQHLEDAKRLDQQEPNGKEMTKEHKDSRRKMFVENCSHIWPSKMRSGGGNFLHYLAAQEYSSKLRQQWLMARAMNRFPNLMGVLDDTKRSPLTVAISAGNVMFVHVVCVNINKRKQEMIGEALRSECEERDIDSDLSGLTCLHAAISTGLRVDLLRSLISFVPESMFSAVDLRRRTPLHLAVEYNRGSPDQLSVVELLLQRGPGALKIRTTHGLGACSVYQYHEKTRKDYRAIMDREQMKPPPRPSRGGQLPDVLRREEKSESDTKKSDRPKKDKFIKEGKLDIATYPQQGQVKTTGSGAVTPTGRRKPLDMSHSTNGVDSALRSMLPTVGRPPASVIDLDLREVELRASSENVRALVKLEYLRQLSPHEVSDYIHVQYQKDKELWYDFGPKPDGKLSEKDFRRQFSHLEFDQVLQYVALPRIELDSHLDGAENDTDGRHCGRRDYLFFFNWLREKGVKRIVRVEVDDMEMPCHSDEAIEESLAGFHVEVLDWKREDIDANTLQLVGGNLREVHLHWSGRNGMLRSWSEKTEGLCKLPMLKKIKLTQVQGLECEPRTKANLEAFELRLLESWDSVEKDGDGNPVFKTETEPRIKLKLDLPQSSERWAQRHGLHSNPSQTAQPQERHVDSHKWMLCMEDFAASFRQIRELRENRSDLALRPVSIALIDDGADISHDELCGRKIPGKSFHSYKEDDWWRVLPYWNSTTGHGTLMARLIQRICPSAAIHVIKLKTAQEANSNKLLIESKSAVQAIRHAVELGVHAICMSWSMKEPAEPAEKIAFDEAIRSAHSKQILMFCAVSDQGSFLDKTYPHSSNPNHTFLIGSAKWTGKTAEYVGDSQNLSFVFPGHDVVMKPLYSDVGIESGIDAFHSHTGSSVATALATGLAALVYECVRLAAIYAIETNQTNAPGAVRVEDLTTIRSKQRMEESLQNIGSNPQTGNKYLLVWNRFEKPARQLRENEGARERQLEVVTILARTFLSGIQDS